MNLPEYSQVKNVKFHHLREEIEEELNSKGDKGLRLQEVWAIQRVLDRKGIELVQDIETTSKASFMMRTTVVWLLLFVLILTFIILPIKWICTGKYYVSSKSKLYRFIKSWERKLD